MKRWEKALIVAVTAVAASLAVLALIDRQFPAEIRMAPVLETSSPETAQAERLPEDPAVMSPETDAADIAGQSVEPADPPELGEPVAPDATAEPTEPTEPTDPEVPDAIVPEELPPPPPPTEP